MVSKTRNIVKSLAVMEDLAVGRSTITQKRGKGTQVDLPIVVSDEAELVTLDVSVYDRARIYTGATYKEYVYYEDEWVALGLASDNIRTPVGTLTELIDGLDVNVLSLKTLTSIKEVEGKRFNVKSFYADTNTGGGTFYFDSTMDKALHNGGTIIAPEALDTWDGQQSDLASLLDWAGIGTGCFIRVTTIPSATAELYIEDFGAINDDGATDNYVALNHVKKLSNLYEGKMMLGSGGTGFGTTLELDTKHTVIIGLDDQPDQRGSVLPSAYMIWLGGEAPMLRSTSSSHVFKGFSVENRGAATSWLDLDSGSIANRYTRLDFIKADSHTMFSEAVIKSNGNRLGYSVFSNIQAKGPADIFLLIDGQASGNAITPVTFNDRCIINTADTPMTFIKIKDEKIETLNITDCTFNQQAGELTLIDTSDTPLVQVFDVLNFNENEIDVNPTNATATQRLFRLHNCPNINMNGNTFSLGGQALAMAELVNSKVTSFNGNYYRTIAGPLFNPDADSSVNEGQNFPDASNTNGVNTTKSAGITVLEYSSVLVLDGYACQAKGGHIFEVSVTNSSGYQVRLVYAKPYYFRVGQVFSVVVKNATGSAISPGAFTNGFGDVDTVAPSPGEYMVYTFYFDGTEAVEVGRFSSGSTGATGSFTSSDGKTISVVNGAITSIV